MFAHWRLRRNDRRAPPSVMLPHTSLDFCQVAYMMPLLSGCILPEISTDALTVGDQHSSVLCRLYALSRSGNELVYSINVSIAGTTVYTDRLTASGREYTTVIKVCGLVYRHTTLQWSPRSPVCRVADGPQHIITPAWPPSRVVACAVALYFQTFNTKYVGATVVQRTALSLVCTLTSADTPCNVHYEYKPDGVGIVIMVGGSRTSHAILFEQGLSLRTPTANAFQWHQHNPLCLPQHVQNLWRLLIAAL